MKRFTLLCAGAFALAAFPVAAEQHRSESGMQEQGGMQGQSGMQSEGGNKAVDVALGFFREADVVGAEGEEIGDVVDIVRPSGEGQGLSAVVNVESGWFDEDTRIVADLNRFTITEEGYLRLDGATEDTIAQYAEYAEDDWEVVGEDYETYEDAYEDYGWNWW